MLYQRQNAAYKPFAEQHFDEAARAPRLTLRHGGRSTVDERLDPRFGLEPRFGMDPRFGTDPRFGADPRFGPEPPMNVQQEPQRTAQRRHKKKKEEKADVYIIENVRGEQNSPSLQICWMFRRERPGGH